MKKVWIPVIVFTGLGLLATLAFGVISIANMVDYEMLGYSVQYLNSEGVTFRVSFLITNPSSYNLELWDQRYEVYVGGYKISDITSKDQYTLLAQNSSVIPLDVSLKWSDIQSKILPFQSQTSTTAIGELPVLIKGRLSARMGILRLSSFPVRFNMRVSDFLP
jgi:hypothetical protein